MAGGEKTTSRELTRGTADLPPVVVPLLMLVRAPFPMGGAERNPAAME